MSGKRKSEFSLHLIYFLSKIVWCHLWGSWANWLARNVRLQSGEIGVSIEQSRDLAVGQDSSPTLSSEENLVCWPLIPQFVTMEQLYETLRQVQEVII